MRPRTRLNEQHTATPMPTAASDRRVLRSQCKNLQQGEGVGSSSNSISRSKGLAAAAAVAAEASTAAKAGTDSRQRIGPGDNEDGVGDVVAPAFRALAGRELEAIRAALEERKAALAEKVLGLKHELRRQKLCAAGRLPASLLDMKVGDFNAQFDCDLVEMVTSAALGIFSGRDGGFDDDEHENGGDAACPATILRGAGREGPRRQVNLRSQSASSSAAAAASGLSAAPAPAGYETPAVTRVKPSNAAFWSTTAKKSKSAAAAGGADSPDEKILTVSKKRGAILETCGMDLLTLAHDPEMAGSLDVASLENIQKLHQLSSMILQHRDKKCGQRGVGTLGAVAEEDDP